MKLINNEMLVGMEHLIYGIGRMVATYHCSALFLLPIEIHDFVETNCKQLAMQMKRCELFVEEKSIKTNSL